MTSTNIFSGMNAERNSSRVLRPPGGGHTDVLGLSAQPDLPVKKTNRRNASSITEGIDPRPAPVEAPKPTSPVDKPEITPVEAPKAVENTSAANQVTREAPSEEKAAAAPTSEPVAAPKSEPAAVSQTTQRVRVPPGGFSSGLW